MLSSEIIVSLIVVLCSILLDTLLGIMVSIKNGEFSINTLPKFIATNVFPYVGGLVLLAGFAYFITSFQYLFYAGVAIVTAKFCKEALLEKISKLFS